MTSRPEHYREAEARIEVHATLALAASNIEAATRRPSPEWAEVVS